MDCKTSHCISTIPYLLTGAGEHYLLTGAGEHYLLTEAGEHYLLTEAGEHYTLLFKSLGEKPACFLSSQECVMQFFKCTAHSQKCACSMHISKMHIL